MNGFVKGMIAGIAAGSAAALIVMPMSGKKAKRRCIMNAVKNMGEFAENIGDIFK